MEKTVCFPLAQQLQLFWANYLAGKSKRQTNIGSDRPWISKFYTFLFLTVLGTPFRAALRTQRRAAEFVPLLRGQATIHISCKKPPEVFPRGREFPPLMYITMVDQPPTARLVMDCKPDARG